MHQQISRDWLKLSDVAQKLGIHPGTVRAWADQGVLPVYRTEGGHRRFLESEIELWMQTSKSKKEVTPDNALNDVLKHIRFKIKENQLETETWYQKLDKDARMKYRMSSKNLMQSLSNFLVAEGAEAIAEARSLGYEYASRGRRYDLSLIDATRAFLFFRNALLEAMMSVYLDSCVSDMGAWGNMLSRINAFTDQTMLSLMETYAAFEKNNL